MMHDAPINQNASNQRDGVSASVGEPDTEWFTIIHATRVGGPKSARFSDYVLGTLLDGGNDGDPRWVPVGKVAGRPEHAIATKLDALLADAVTERFGPTVSIRPNRVMVEVRHHGYRENRRTKAGRVLVEPEVVSMSPGNAR